MTRIGTWNLQGRSSARRIELQRAFMEREDCDVWLLTEVSDAFARATTTETIVVSAAMGPAKSYAAVWARGGLSLRPPIHEAAAFATVDGVRVCSCVLPWRAAPSQGWPAVDGNDLASVTRAAIGRLRRGLTPGPGSGDLVWGGDWNQALEGRDPVGTAAGRAALTESIARLGLQVLTAGLAHECDRMSSIDHIAFPMGWRVGSAVRRVAEADGIRLSDHDAYVVEAQP